MTGSMIGGRLAALTLVAALMSVAACSGSGQDEIVLDPAPTVAATSPSTGALSTPTATSPAVTADVAVSIDISAPGAPISPAILGVSSDLSAAEMTQAGLHVNSWGGNPSTRYNYDIGHAWNRASDGEFRNTSYGVTADDAALDYIRSNDAAGVLTRMAIPTLGWVAKDDVDDNCSFPSGGRCLPASEVGNCGDPKATADPRTASVESTPEQVLAWLTRMAAAGATPDFVSMDNEPDLWGATHFDVHPECTTYEEILGKYLDYAPQVREVLPDAALTGPALCCWYDYWHIAPGPADGSGQDFLSWFLDGVRLHDERTGQRSIDYLDVHYYPQSGVFNDDTDAETNARRLRSTRSLWDPGYKDESWINDRIEFIPRMRETIAEHYPGTKLFISEWNFGADTTMNGALAIADVLGTYGRTGVEAAAYWRNPPVGSPGFFAFTMYGNYDGDGSRIGGVSVPAVVDDGDNGVDRVSAYAALDDTTGLLRVVLLNKELDADLTIALDTSGFAAASDAKRYVYGPANLEQIVADTAATGVAITLPASSITVLELEPAG